MVRKTLINIARRLYHVDILFKVSMKECIVNIKLPNLPSTLYCKCQNHTDGGGLDHRTVGVIVVNAMPLFKSLGDKTRLKPINRAIWFALDRPCRPIDYQ
jgi:hypothetical protein